MRLKNELGYGNFDLDVSFAKKLKVVRIMGALEREPLIKKVIFQVNAA